MPAYYVYILFSLKCHRFYTGHTGNIIKRFHSHNGLATKGYTIRCRPYVLVYWEPFDSKPEAIQREKFLKTGAGRRWVAENEQIKHAISLFLKD